MSLIVWCTIICTLILATIIWYYYKYCKLRKLMNYTNGPFPAPLIGNIIYFWDIRNILNTFASMLKEYGNIVIIMLTTKPFILIADHEAIQTILASNTLLDKGFMYDFLSRWLNKGLLVSNGEKWKTRRHILVPSYHFQVLEHFVPIFNKVGHILVDQLRKEKNKNAVDVYPYVTLSTLDIICETAMGISINAQLDKDSSYVRSIKQMARITMDRVFTVMQQFEVTYRFSANYKIEQECLSILHDFNDSIIKRRREELTKTQSESIKTENDIGAKKRVAFLDMLLQVKDDHGQPLSDADIREEVDTFMFAGHDTTASGISFALYEIANHPDVQKKIIEEQEEILHGDNREFTISDLNQMKYLEMVIKEVLRLYPSVPFFARVTNEEFQLTKDIRVPPGCTLVISAYSVHRNPEVYPEPDKFDPERFRAENCHGKQPYSYIPFSAGPRNCIGQKFALLEMKSTLSKLVRCFELFSTEPRHYVENTLESTLRSNNGMIIGINERIKTEEKKVV